ncbi:hypothetical protein HMPREF1548_05955 [Clostridium sp. KLE 1755]|nr:hypothetical protein HMPREF1548_05955 [Clostridium sp. KLE 1755]
MIKSIAKGDLGWILAVTVKGTEQLRIISQPCMRTTLSPLCL